MNKKYKELAYYIGRMKGEIRYIQDTLIVDKFVNDIVKNVLSNYKDFDRNQFLQDIEDARLESESKNSNKCTIIIYKYPRGKIDNIVSSNISTDI